MALDNIINNSNETLMSILKNSGNVLFFDFMAQGGQFNVIEFELTETLSEPFVGRIRLASAQFDIQPENFLDQDATLNIYRDGILERSFNGIIKSFTKGDSGHEHTFYDVELAPSLYRLDLKHDSRIFQGQSVVDITELLFQEMGLTDYVLSMQGQHLTREYCVQYRETCLEFLSRIWSEEGIFYHFEHEEAKHTLVLSDTSSGTAHLEKEYIYNNNSGGSAHEPFIRQFSTQASLSFTNAVLKDYSFKQPSFDFLSHEFGYDDGLGDGYEYYDYPGRYKDIGVGQYFAKTRIQFLQRDSNTIEGKGMYADFCAGFHFLLMGHHDGELNRKWLLTSVYHKGTQPQALGKYGGDGLTSYNNHFMGIPNHRQWKPEPVTKPRVDGPQVAKVTGPQGEEIYCDEFGRVKVQFPWDRYGASNEESTCWIRVVQGWAGASYGQVSIPRIGHEVIVSFLEGDPDQPIITGRSYHATNRQPFKLPANKTISGIKTQTHKGSGFNEYSFDDEAGEEKITVHAQKDMNTLVKNDQVNHIEHDYHLKVDNLQMTLVKNTAHYTVEGERRTDIKSNEYYKTEASLHAKQAGKWLVETGDEIHFKAGSKIVFEAGDEITTKVGGSFVKITASKIDIVAPTVGINAGGSPGNGTPIDTKSPLTPVQLSTLGGPAPFCEECEKCKNGMCEVPTPSKETQEVNASEMMTNNSINTPKMANNIVASSGNVSPLPMDISPLNIVSSGLPKDINVNLLDMLVGQAQTEIVQGLYDAAIQTSQLGLLKLGNVEMIEVAKTLLVEKNVSVVAPKLNQLLVNGIQSHKEQQLIL